MVGDGGVVLILDPENPQLIPLGVANLFTGPIQYTEDVPMSVVWELRDAHPVMPGERPDGGRTLLSTDPAHPAVRYAAADGAEVREVHPKPPAPAEPFAAEVSTAATDATDVSAAVPGLGAPDSGAVPPGFALLEAVAIMDTLRSHGPWEGAQTHASLTRYLIEETYELLDAIAADDRTELRSELADLLLQVLFHARIAADDPTDPFTIDDVAREFIAKVTRRTPALLGGTDDVAAAGAELDVAAQIEQWEERKRAEKPDREILDGVSLDQPALALAQKIFERLAARGLDPDQIPAELLRPSVDPHGNGDAEADYRAALLAYVAQVTGRR